MNEVLMCGISTSQALRKEKFKMYESPISLITQEVYEQTEEMIYRAVTKVGVDVDKEELVKALQYDRNQYDKAFMEGYNKAIDDLSEKLCCAFSENSTKGECEGFTCDILTLDSVSDLVISFSEQLRQQN